MRLPERCYAQDADGPGAGSRLTEEMVDAMVDEYFALRGWDSRGVPTKERLHELDLEEVAAELENLALYQDGGAAR